MYKTHAGFSFVDLTVTLLLLGILLSVSIPEFKSHPTKDLDAVSLQIEELLERSRGLAAYAEQKVSISISEKMLLTEVAGSTEFQVTAPPGVGIESSHATFSYLPTGTNTPGNITLTQGGRRCSLTISLLGKVRRACTGSVNE